MSHIELVHQPHWKWLALLRGGWWCLRCGRTEVQHKETETGRLPRNEEIRKKERDKDKELMKEGLSTGDVWIQVQNGEIVSDARRVRVVVDNSVSKRCVDCMR